MRAAARHVPLGRSDESQPLVQRHIVRRRGLQPARQALGTGDRGLRADDPPAVPLALIAGPHADIMAIPEAPFGPMRVDAALPLQPARQGGAEGRDERADGAPDFRHLAVLLPPPAPTPPGILLPRPLRNP